MLRVIVAGGRRFNDYQLVKKTLDFLLKNRKKEEVLIISGACDTGILTFNRPDGTIVCGADGLGERYAQEKGYKVKAFPANWKAFGKSAGYKRNEEMAVYASNTEIPKTNGCVCFWDGQSRGTGNMIDLAIRYKLKLKKVLYN